MVRKKRENISIRERFIIRDINKKKITQFLSEEKADNFIIANRGKRYKVQEKFDVFNDKGKKIKTFNTEKDIKLFFQEESRKAGKEVILKTKKDLKKELEKFQKKPKKFDPKQRTIFYNNENRLTVSNRQRSSFKFSSVFIRVKLWVHFNGVRYPAQGFSNHYDQKMPQKLIKSELFIAIRRALAPFGYNVSWELRNWDFLYYRVKGTDFSVRKQQQLTATAR